MSRDDGISHNTKDRDASRSGWESRDGQPTTIEIAEPKRVDTLLEAESELHSSDVDLARSDEGAPTLLTSHAKDDYRLPVLAEDRFVVPDLPEDVIQ